ncbi:MAG: DUF499 domain-containing protein [Coprothermobacterota bacterium]|nr:DUF499 domain-containing protein [Coprothermobacterota bacterium]
MILPNWWQVATPHRDIQEGRFTESVYAADLSAVLMGQAPDEYQDASLFFKRTHLTNGLNRLLQNAVSRFQTGEGDPVIQLKTPFGGGKTHALLTLYHFFKSQKEISYLESLKEFREARVPDVKVAVFVGTYPDVFKGRTPWGEIAYQLGHYSLMEESDLRRTAPGKKLILEMLSRSGPTLILIDEMLEYITRFSKVEEGKGTPKGQVIAFLQELSEAVKTRADALLVLTLPSSLLEQYDEEAQRALEQMEHIIGRMETIYTPVDEVEISEIIRKRLFEDLGDPSIHRQVAEAYYHLYQELKNDIPSEARQLSYRDKILCSYPFHPELIDCLYQRWGSFPHFQRTRGVLRLLALVVAQLYQKKTPSPLIQSSLIDLSSQKIKDEFVKHIGLEFNSVIASDITGKARHLDSQMGSEYQKYGIAEGLATATFLYSFSGGERKGITLPQLRLALLREGIPATIVGDAVTKLEESLWYFHTEQHLYSFKNQPNINRLIVEREEAVERPEILLKIKGLVEGLSPTGCFDIRVWPESSLDIPDTKRLKLVFLHPQMAYGSAETEQKAREILERAGESYRVYRNALFLLAFAPEGLNQLEKQIRRSLALSDLLEREKRTLTQEVQEELKKRLTQVGRELPSLILNAYRKVAWFDPGNSKTSQGIKWLDIGQPSPDEKDLGERVFKALKDSRILTQMTPRLVLEKTFAPGEEEKTLQEIFDIFFKTPGLPVPQKEEVLFSAVRRGAESRILGVRASGKVFFGSSPDVELTLEDVVLTPEKATKEIEKELQGLQPAPPPTGPDEGKTPPNQEKDEKHVKKLKIKVKVHWDRLSDFMSGVINPIKLEGSIQELTIELEASASQEFTRYNLDNRIRETLSQICSKIDEWIEE